MDLQSLKDQVSNLTLYDIKAGVRKVQNGEHSRLYTSALAFNSRLPAVMNYTEMEAKVREATNNDPWGCPSTVSTSCPSEGSLTDNRKAYARDRERNVQLVGGDTILEHEAGY